MKSRSHKFLGIYICLAFSFVSVLGRTQTDFPGLKQQFLDYRKADLQDSALLVARKMNQLALKEQTDTSFWYALSFRYIGNPYNTWGNSDSTLFYWKKSVYFFERYHPQSSEHSYCIEKIVKLYAEEGKYAEAESFLLKAIELKKKDFGELNNEYISLLSSLGTLYKSWGKYKLAEDNFKDVLEFKRSIVGDTNLDYASALTSVGNLYKEMGNFPLAEHCYQKSLDIKFNANGGKTKDYALGLNNLGYLYSEMGKYDTSLFLIQQSINILFELNIDSTEIIEKFHSLATVYFEMGKYTEAEKYFQIAIGFLTQRSPLKQEVLYRYDLAENYIAQARYDQAMSLLNYLDSLTNGQELERFKGDIYYSVGKIYSKKGNYKQAKEYYNKALSLREQIIPGHSDLAVSLNSIAVILYKMGAYDEAEQYYKRALEVRELALGKEHPDYASSLDNLGVLYKAMGDYQLAELNYKEALAIRKKTLGEEHPSYAMSLNHLGVLYKAMGDYKTAEPLYNQCIEVYKKSLGEEHPDYAGSLNNLGNLYFDMGEYQYAAPLFYKSLEIKKKTLGEQHPAYAIGLQSLGGLYRVMGDFNSAEQCYVRAIEIKQKVLTEDHVDYANAIYGIGLLYKAQGDHAKALEKVNLTLSIYKNKYGQTHPSYISTHVEKAYLLMELTKFDESFDILTDCFEKKSKEIADNFEWLNDNQKELYWKKESSFYDKLSWFANESFATMPKSVGLNYNAVLVTKGKLLEAKISSENYYLEVDELREELAFCRRLITKMESDGSAEKNKLELLHKEADSLDKRLALSWPEYAQQKKNLSITWNQVQQNLDKGEAAIEYVRFYNSNDSLYYYNALVLKKGDLYPQLVPLCTEKQIKEIKPKLGFSAYYPLVWKPLEAFLNEIETIYYAPIGELNNIPFQALYEFQKTGDELIAAKTDKRGVVVEEEQVTTEQNAVFLMDRYTLHQLTSTRYLAMGLKQKTSEVIPNSLAIIGGVNYDYLPGNDTKPKSSKKDKNLTRSSESASGKLSYLEGTKTEVERIRENVTTSTWQTTLLENSAATEETIIQFEGKEAKGILHLATHGYAFPVYNYKDTAISSNSLKYSYRYSSNPMVRSGLILAGGNWAWTGSDTLSKLGAEQNGILTALEVSQLNLRKTKLVVLSACETGLGKIEGSEGTFGLKRGFKLAGVEQLIVSLWSVPDKETMELMTLFYTDLAQTLTPVISFEKAQKEMRNRYPTEPDKWAGFVLVR